MVYLCLYEAGKDVAFSESAGKLLCPQSLQQAVL